MSGKRGRGNAESSWLVARRCLDIINRLQQGAASKQDLLAMVYGDEDVLEDEVLTNRFDKDKERLRDRLQVPIRYDKGVKGYVIGERERPLLNLPDADIETLAFLADTFQPDSPHAAHVHRLIDQLVDWLPPGRQRLFKRLSGQQPTADLRLRDREEIAPDVWEATLAGWQAKQELQFDYLSGQQEDGLPRQHHIQPWDLYFSDRGHWHVRGFCLFNDGPFGPWQPHDYINYRLSRIVPGSVEMLPRKLPEVRPSGRLRQVVFELGPAIARFGISQRKELVGEPQVSALDDGWVRVEGQTHDVFDLARNLLYYGKNCRILGGRELRQEMQELVKQLGEIYQ